MNGTVCVVRSDYKIDYVKPSWGHFYDDGGGKLLFNSNKISE